MTLLVRKAEIFVLVLVLASGCSEDGAPGARAGTEGAAHFDLVSTSGDKESLGIAGPPGELEARFVETAKTCKLELSASDPRQGDKTSAAKARRVVLSISVPATPPLLSGKGDTIDVIQTSPLKGDAMVRVERGTNDWWHSLKGGQIVVSPFEPRVGAELSFELRGVALAPGGSTEGERVVDGRASAKLQRARVNGSAGGCPDGTPGR